MQGKSETVTLWTLCLSLKMKSQCVVGKRNKYKGTKVESDVVNKLSSSVSSAKYQASIDVESKGMGLCPENRDQLET